jgi:glycosyltransferase involved in cell wall biosynthesis
MVALEGIACGCIVVGSSAGGLRDAIGPCGMTFMNGDMKALSQAIRDAIEKKDSPEVYWAKASAHLERHRAESVASRYLRIFEQAYRKSHRTAEILAN